MSLTVQDWTRSVALDAAATVSFTVEASAPVVSLRLDAIGDGLPGVTVRGDDLRAVSGLSLPMRVRGTHSLHVWAVDANGCEAETGLRREVVVQ